MGNIQELINQVLSLKKELEQLKTQVVPVGAVEAFAMKDAPVGWLVCDGGMYSSELYPLLSKALGATYNQPDTPEGFFCVPDLQGLFIRGWDKDGNVDGERDFGTIQEDAMQGHGHDVVVNGTKISTQSNGDHTHDVYYKNYRVRDTLGVNSTVVYECTSSSFKGGENSSSTSGSHNHKVSVESGFVKVSKVTSLNHGVVRVDKETRPKNIALLYCIKAENLRVPDTLAETGYSTIVEKVKKELMGTIVPLSRTLPIVAIGGKEYLANIEKIKQSHFCNRPSNRQDLIYATAQCFNDICVYNVRNGQRSEQFDAFGLDLLVSWIIDKGMLAQKEKLLFIEEVKNYISSLLLAITPK